MFLQDNLYSNGPSPDDIYPVTNNKSIIFLKNIISKSRIIVGDYTTYTPICDEYRDFEKSNVLYYSEALNDYLKIGKFCHVSSNVRFIMNAANHTYTNFTSYGFGFLGGGWVSDSDNPQYKKLGFPSDHIIKGDILVGNSVWLGYDCIIMPGVTIGDGAVVGAGSVVTKDVPAYSVVAGNPAEVVKMIFSQEITQLLLDLKWWDLPIEMISKNIHIISGSDINELKKLFIEVREYRKRCNL